MDEEEQELDEQEKKTYRKRAKKTDELPLEKI